MVKVYELSENTKIKANSMPPDDERCDIVDCLTQNGACSLRVIVTETDLDEDTARSIISNLMREGIVLKRDESGLTLDRV